MWGRLKPKIGIIAESYSLEKNKHSRKVIKRVTKVLPTKGGRGVFNGAPRIVVPSIASFFRADRRQTHIFIIEKSLELCQI